METVQHISTDGTIFIGSNNGNLYAINPDGTQKWYFQTNGAIQSFPVIGYVKLL